jgi:hypothetical protein
MKPDRRVNSPTVDPSDYVLPITQGGTGANSRETMIIEFSLVANSRKGQPNGILGLNSQGKIDKVSFGSMDTGTPVSIKAPSIVPAGSQFVILITDFDSDRNYSPVTSGDGSAAMFDQSIKVTAPSTLGAFTVTIAGKAFSFTAN